MMQVTTVQHTKAMFDMSPGSGSGLHSEYQSKPGTFRGLLHCA